MKNAFVVTDEEGNISWSDKTEAAEKFSTFKAANKRAMDLAAFAPGKTISIYALAAETTCPVAPAVTKHAKA